MIRRPPRSTLFPYTDALPIFASGGDFAGRSLAADGQRACLFASALVAEHARNRGSVGQRRSGSAASCRRSEEHTSELQSRRDLVCRLLLEKKKQYTKTLHRFL